MLLPIGGMILLGITTTTLGFVCWPEPKPHYDLSTEGTFPPDAAPMPDPAEATPDPATPDPATPDPATHPAGELPARADDAEPEATPEAAPGTDLPAPDPRAR